jgi:L-alanine-DL-glutamate epimerase-like enolase superfamily enzyme
MKITHAEVIPIFPRLAERYEDRKIDLYGIDHRLVYKVHTDNGLIGYGDNRVRPGGTYSNADLEYLIGRDPCDFINNPRHKDQLGGAFYDVVGKYLEVPVYKLMGGQKVREAVKVAAWTRPASPEHFRSEVRRAADQGYMVFKMHSCTYHDIIEQTRMAEEVAPEGFKIHWDFNGRRTMAAALPLIKQLERDHPIVGFIEEPVARSDLTGWRMVREQTGIPIVMHVPQLGGIQEVVHQVADIFMIDAGGLGLARGLAYSQLNIQTIIQHGAGTLGKALALHTAAVLPTADGHSINLDDQYEEDYTTDTIPVIEGYSPVPEGIGLGFEVDDDTIARMAANTPIEQPRFVGILHMPGGHTFYGPGQIGPYGEEGTVRGFRTELWEEDGSAEFDKIYQRVSKEGRIPAQ